MKKILASLVLIASLAIPLVGLAVNIPTGTTVPEAPTISICCGSGTLIWSITNWLFIILLAIAAIAIIVAGYFFVTATGDPDKTKKARDFVLYAVIGVLVGFAAKGLVVLMGTIAGESISWW